MLTFFLYSRLSSSPTPSNEMAQTFDYSNGSVVVQHGIIYYSPNCTRPVVIPPCPAYPSDLFRALLSCP
jgi:hypothetical protein